MNKKRDRARRLIRILPALLCLVGFMLLPAGCGTASQPSQKPESPDTNAMTTASETVTPTPEPESEASTPAPSPSGTPTPSPTAKPRPEMSATPEPVRKDTRLPFSRGVNLGNCLEAPLEGAWGLVIQDEWMTAIQGAGFDHIRLPVKWSAYAQKEAPFAIDEKILERVDHVIETALAADLGVVLNVHHYDEMATDPEAHADRLAAIWTQLAEHYKNQPETVAFELMNEPNGVADPVWPKMQETLHAQVRATDPDRWLCITNGSWSSAGRLSTLTLSETILADERTFATFHFYEPFSFTHQNASWVAGSDAWAGTKWNGNTMQQRQITNLFDQVSGWSARNGDIPVLMGEFGAYSAADPISRQRWTEFCAREAERRGFAWTYWEFASGFGIYGKNSKQFDTALLKALIP